MSIQAKTEYVSSGGVIAAVTLPGHNGIATHALISMLSGLAVRWKQTVAYYFTGFFDAPYSVSVCFLWSVSYIKSQVHWYHLWIKVIWVRPDIFGSRS